jgi:proteasome lid subunit RPN8/RPN11
VSALHLPERLRARLRGWSRLAAPREACGLLIGRPVDGGIAVERVTWARNVDPRRDRYEVDPEGVLAASRAASASGAELVGAWHSHPGGSARPSETDRRSAHAGWTYVIVAGADLRAFRRAGDELLEQPLARPDAGS